MKHFFILIILLGNLFTISGQAGYYDYPENSKVPVFFDDFVDNRNNWIVQDDHTIRLTVGNGELFMQSKDGTPKLNSIEVDIDEARDWEIELKLRYSAGEADNANGLVWGSDINRYDRYRFTFTGDGYYSIDYNYQNNWYDIVNWTKSDFVYTNDYNLLTVRKVKSTFYFFLNRLLVKQTNNLPFYGNVLGVHCNLNTTISADYLKVSYLDRMAGDNESLVANRGSKGSQSNNRISAPGKYYALIIGNNSYRDPAITSLDYPISDAGRLYNVLTTKYSFDPPNVALLQNASYVQMIEAFDNLSNKLTENDNLLVFYAGHGWWDEDKNLGYWLPVDAKKRSTAYWIANSRISDYMSSIKTRHTLLIADACFSGSIFKTRSAFVDAGQAINSLYNLPSRTAMTSGNLKEVPDKSVFLEYLVKRLETNPEKYLSADQLFSSFRIAVMNNSRTEPQIGTIQNAGDEGGEFIFIQRY